MSQKFLVRKNFFLYSAPGCAPNYENFSGWQSTHQKYRKRNPESKNLSWIEKDSRILSDKKSDIVLSELADSSVNIRVRVWVNRKDFQPVKFDFNEKVYKEFPKKGLNIPYPQLDVNLNK